ncbi:MAG: DUF6473 family protein [Dongiaceae bacterium]
MDDQQPCADHPEAAPCAQPELPDLPLRGPLPDLTKPYIACIGGSRTFGGVDRLPFPAILAELSGTPVLNLGASAGIAREVLDRPGLLDVLNQAEAVVLEASPGWIAAPAGPPVGPREAGDLEAALALLRKLRPPRIVLRIGDPADDPGSGTPAPPERAAIERLRSHAEALIEPGANEGAAGAEALPDDAEGDARIAGRLAAALGPFLAREQASAPGADDAADRRLFILLAAARTGTNLLGGLLHGQPGIFMGGEIFTEDPSWRDAVAWDLNSRLVDPDLTALRGTDPVSFLGHLIDRTPTGTSLVGFKISYYDADQHPAIKRYLAEHHEVAIIHLRRRNWIRRFLSERRAQETKEWFAPRNAESKAPPAIRLDPFSVCGNIAYIAGKENEYAALFGQHRVLNVFYEDLEARPNAVAARAARFLGATPVEGLVPAGRKQGTDSLREAIANYDELRSTLLGLADLLED